MVPNYLYYSGDRRDGDGNRRAVQVRHGAPQLIKDVGNCISCNRSGGGAEAAV